MSNGKNVRSKSSKSRLPATSSLTQPVVSEASLSALFSAFSTSGDLFALLSLGIDKHRLRVYDVNQAQSIAEHTIVDARVTCLAWVNLDLSQDQTIQEDGPSKKRKKRNSTVSNVNNDTYDTSLSNLQVVALGLSDGSTILYSPNQSRVIRTLSHPSSSNSILAITSHNLKGTSCIMWTSDAEGMILSWDARKNEVLGKWTSDERIGYTAIITRLDPEDDNRADLLVASHVIRLLDTSSQSLLMKSSGNERPKVIFSFTGHASSINSLYWDESETPPRRFFSTAEGDRFVNCWEVPDSASTEGRLAASIPTDADIRQIATTVLLGRPTVLVLSITNKITIIPIPSELSPVGNTKRQRQEGVSTLVPRATIMLSREQKADEKIISAIFAPGENGKVKLARLIGGVRPIFDVVSFFDDREQFVAETVMESGTLTKKINGIEKTLPLRYAEPSNVVIAAGTTIEKETELDEIADRDINGDLDVDLAELSLGQRLNAVNGTMVENGNNLSDSDQDDAGPSTQKSNGLRRHRNQSIVPSNSLTRTLTQALHSSDSKLLETCLAHSDDNVIQNTVRRLPAQLTIPLLMACVERLGRGGRAGNMKGRGGGASSQRGMGLISWIKAVLSIHSGYLMTVPDLVARLSALHAALTKRLTLQERLLTLNGKLDLVISQIEMRSVVASNTHSKKKSGASKRKPKHYVERASSDEDEMVIEASDDDGGSIEEVQLGNDSQDEELDEDENMSQLGDIDEDDDEDDEEEEELHMNGFIDDEAEEDNFEEDESDDESE